MAVPETALIPALAAIVAGTKNSNINKTREILSKYIIFKLYEKYLKQNAENVRKSIIYKIPIITLINLPPKNSEISKMSEFTKGVKNLQTNNTKSKLIMVRYKVFKTAPVEVKSKIIVGILIIILVLTIVINKA